MRIKQTVGRDKLGDFAPDFARYNDDVLFGEVWNDTTIDLKMRSVITVVCLMSQGICDSSLMYHLSNAKKHGVNRDEISAIVTHVGFYAGWPKAWAVFNLCKDVWNDDVIAKDEMERHQAEMIFPIGEFNEAYSEYFIGKSYLAPISLEQVKVFNVTFEPGCRNNWHIHESESGGGQILICVAGEGYYQEYGKKRVLLKAGDSVNILPGVKHWHGATSSGWFSHLAIEVPGVGCSTKWLEPVGDDCYEND